MTEREAKLQAYRDDPARRARVAACDAESTTAHRASSQAQWTGRIAGQLAARWCSDPHVLAAMALLERHGLPAPDLRTVSVGTFHPDAAARFDLRTRRIEINRDGL